jgi:hypothetical protein
VDQGCFCGLLGFDEMKKSLIASVVLVAGAGLPSGALPEIVLIPLPEKGRLAVFRPAFHKYVEVFGVLVVATAKTEDAKILHAGNVLAQYLDNDADGKPDNPEVVANLRKRGAFVAMAERERDFRRLRINWEKLERAGFELGQDLYGEETQPAGPPHLFCIWFLMVTKRCTPRPFVSVLEVNLQMPWTLLGVDVFGVFHGATRRQPGTTMTMILVTMAASVPSIFTGL